MLGLGAKATVFSVDPFSVHSSQEAGWTVRDGSNELIRSGGTPLEALAFELSAIADTETLLITPSVEVSGLISHSFPMIETDPFSLTQTYDIDPPGFDPPYTVATTLDNIVVQLAADVQTELLSFPSTIPIDSVTMKTDTIPFLSVTWYNWVTTTLEPIS
jgi:hypothetical protein